MRKSILINRIQTPDGTILTSRHRHDYVTYVDKNGLEYMVDGGTAYLRRIVHTPTYNIIQRILMFFGVRFKDNVTYKELSIYYNENTPIETIREHFKRGGRGKSGKETVTYVKLKDMSDNWIKAVIEYEERLRPENPTIPWFKQELEYRKLNNIKIDE